MHYSVQKRDPIFVKGYGFFSFDQNMGENIVKNVSKTWSGKYSWKHLNHAQQSATDAFKTASISNGDLIDNKKFQKFHQGSYKWEW